MTKTSMYIEDSELVESCTWHRKRHGVTPVPLSVFTTCICGYFHTYTKAAEAIARRCKDLGLIAIKNKIIIFNHERK